MDWGVLLFGDVVSVMSYGDVTRKSCGRHLRPCCQHGWKNEKATQIQYPLPVTWDLFLKPRLFMGWQKRAHHTCTRSRSLQHLQWQCVKSAQSSSSGSICTRPRLLSLGFTKPIFPASFFCDLRKSVWKQVFSEFWLIFAFERELSLYLVLWHPQLGKISLLVLNAFSMLCPFKYTFNQ